MYTHMYWHLLSHVNIINIYMYINTPIYNMPTIHIHTYRIHTLQYFL